MRTEEPGFGKLGLQRRFGLKELRDRKEDTEDHDYKIVELMPQE